jgi:solute carrier family 25 phosphate transporter 23/24/25/41
MELIKTRLAIGKSGQYKGIFDCAYQCLKMEGPKAFYKGYLPNIIGIIPYAGIDLTVYETLKKEYTKRHPDNADPNIFALLVCGTVSSTCGQLASYPLALIRTKMQAAGTTSAVQEDLTMRGLFKRWIPRSGD